MTITQSEYTWLVKLAAEALLERALAGRDGHGSRERHASHDPSLAVAVSPSAGATEQAEPDGPPAASRRSSGETLRPRSTPNP